MSDESNKLLVQQMVNKEQMDRLIALATDYIQCDEECQKNKKKEDLYKKYNDAQTTMHMAPAILEKTREKYYVYAHGQQYYDDMILKEATESINTIVSGLKDSFESQLSVAKSMAELLETTYSSSEISLSTLDDYEMFKLKVANEINKNENEAMVNDRTAYYSDESTQKLKMYQKLLKIMYYFAIVVFMILKLPKSASELIPYGIIVGLLFLYPMIAYSGSRFFYNNGLIVIFYIMSIVIMFSCVLFILFLLSKSFKHVLISLYTVVLKIYTYVGR